MERIKILSSVLVFFFSSVLFAQKKDNETDKFIDYVDENYFDQPLIAIKKLEEYLTEYKVKDEQDAIDLDNLYYGLAYYSLTANDLEKTKFYSKTGIENIENNKIDGKAAYYNLLGSVAQTENKLDSSAMYYVDCIKALEEEKDFGKIPFVLNNIALTYSIQGDYKKALENHLKAFYLIKDSESENGVLKSSISGNISQVYFTLDSLDKANKFANITILLDPNNMLRGGLIDAYGTKSKIALTKGLKDSAYYYSQKAYELALNRDDQKSIAKTSVNLAKLILEDNPSKAINYALTGYKIQKEGNDKDFILTARILSEAYFNNKDYQNAAIYQKQYIKYQDSLLKSDYNKNTIDILEKYQASQKELKIKEQRLELTKKENQKRTYSIIAASLAAIALLLIVLFIQNRKTQKQKIVNLENEKENIALRSLMAGEEKERSRIAKELHDGIGSLLAASKMHASKLHADNSESNQTLLTLLDNASKETRRISHNLLPESLMNKGLDVALQDFISSINESQLLKADYQSINLSNTLPQSMQLSIYRIVQELINNIIKHSEATEALVQLNQNKNKLIITVEDNGKGFAFDTSNKGIGLQNIESRLSLLNGKIEVDSKEALGTSVYIEFELEK